MSDSYTYQDGAANQYYINPTSIKYNPVRPENSSSGTYDGGPSWGATLEEEGFVAISDKFEAIILNTKIHVTKRAMGTGRIIRRNKTEGVSENWLIRNGSAKDALESFLKEFAV